MLLNLNELIDQRGEIEFFNSIGRQNGFEGRLTVKLLLNPTPRIEWEFESAAHSSQLQSPFGDAPITLTSWEESDPFLVVVNPQITDLRDRVGLPRNRGNALQVWYGDINSPAHRFEFYLANAHFMSESHWGTLTAITQERGGRTRTTRQAGRAFQAAVADGWTVDLEISQHALDWLEPKQQNRGSMITTSGLLYQSGIELTKSYKLPPGIQAKSLLQVRDLLNELAWLISFANAGDVGPLYIKAERFTGQRQSVIEPVAAAALAYTTTPMEMIGTSWVTHASNLQAFVECFPTFQRMLANPAWKEKWMTILEWYFQAVPPRLWGRGKTWFTVSNALGTLIEHLARLILVDDETDLAKKQTHGKLFKLGKSKERLERLLNRIGLLSEATWIEDFVDIRNDATHAIIKNPLPVERRLEVIQRANQWVDEVLLWRLGYSDHYLDRTANNSIQPRYDLSLRDPNW